MPPFIGTDQLGRIRNRIRNFLKKSDPNPESIILDPQHCFKIIRIKIVRCSLPCLKLMLRRRLLPWPVPSWQSEGADVTPQRSPARPTQTVHTGDPRQQQRSVCVSQTKFGDKTCPRFFFTDRANREADSYASKVQQC